MHRIPPRRVSFRAAAGDVLSAALGRARRDDPIRPVSGGPAGNAVLTAWTGLLILGAVLVEAATLISLRQLLVVHIVVGVVLVSLTLLKIATTGWRVVRYYCQSPAYRQAGPPPTLLRALGPFLVLSTLAVLGSGLALIALGSAAHSPLFVVGGFQIDAVTVHQGSVIAGALLIGLHVLGRVVPALSLIRRRHEPRQHVPGRRLRVAALAMSVALGAVGSDVVLQAAGFWTHGVAIDFDHDNDHDITIG